MIERGELDAVLGATGSAVQAAPGVRAFTAEEWLPVLGELQRKIGVTPVNHAVVVQKRLLAERPSLARDIYTAFEQGKREAYAHNPKARAILPDVDLAKQTAMFGDDPYPYGLRANRNVLELIGEQNVLDGMIRERFAPDTLVAESVRDT
jgi:4,5-dihydroxyphthalate decarboxylase